MANQITGKTESSLLRGLDRDKTFDSFDNYVKDRRNIFAAATNNHLNYWFICWWMHFPHRLVVWSLKCEKIVFEFPENSCWCEFMLLVFSLKPPKLWICFNVRHKNHHSWEAETWNDKSILGKVWIFLIRDVNLLKQGEMQGRLSVTNGFNCSPC